MKNFDLLIRSRAESTKYCLSWKDYWTDAADRERACIARCGYSLQSRLDGRRHAFPTSQSIVDLCCAESRDALPRGSTDELALITVERGLIAGRPHRALSLWVVKDYVHAFS